MKRNLEVFLIVVGCALVFSQAARNHKPSPTPMPALATPAGQVKLYECPHLFDDPKTQNLFKKAESHRKDPSCLAEYDRLIALQPNNPVGHYHKAYALDDQNRPDAAILVVNRAIEIEPGFANAWWLRAYCRDQSDQHKDWQLGVDDVSRAIDLDPDASNYDMRAGLLLKLGRLEEALADSDRAVRAEPARDYLIQRAEICEALGKLTEAARDRKAASTAPEAN
ncbi:tetratricopeptide repeat protein [bacterium]|nr:tetratricopeptide repeat protein [bacterium]